MSLNEKLQAMFPELSALQLIQIEQMLKEAFNEGARPGSLMTARLMQDARALNLINNGETILSAEDASELKQNNGQDRHPQLIGSSQSRRQSAPRPWAVPII